MDNIKKKIVKVFMLLAVAVFSAFTVTGDIFDSIADAMRKNNTKEVAKYFNSSIEMKILDMEGVYSKSQAESVLKGFMAKNQCTKFEISHRSSQSNNNSFCIASYSSSTSIYRVHIFVKNIDGKEQIHSFRIEPSE